MPEDSKVVVVPPEVAADAMKSNEELHAFNNQAVSDAFAIFKKEIASQYAKQFDGITLRISAKLGVEGLDVSGKQLFGYTSALMGLEKLPAAPV